VGGARCGERVITGFGAFAVDALLIWTAFLLAAGKDNSK
jgi:hypothetical protein